MSTSPHSDLATFAADRELLKRWLRGNLAAVLFVEHLLYVCHLWDDLIDRDRERPAEQINVCFWLLLVDIPSNPFYRENAAQLQPLIASAINDWHAANALERDKSGRDISYTLRCSVLSIVTHCAYLCGGWDWAQDIGAEIRRYGQRQSLKDYKKEFACQK